VRKTAVIGGAGFIGARLLPHLARPLVIDRSVSKEGPDAHRIDVRERERLSDALGEAGTVYLLAAEHADDVDPPSLYYEVNVGGAENVIAAAESHGIRRIVFTSTVAVYGLNAPDASEETSPDPFNDYGRSKWEAEQKLMEWAEQDGGRSLVIVRPSVVFGEGNRGNVHNLLRQVHSGRFMMVGRGRNRKSMAYVGNLAHFLVGLEKSPPGIQVFNYSDKPDLDMRRLVRIAADELGVRLPRVAVPYPVGLAAGYGCDLLARITGRKLPISSVRVRKFCAETTVETRRVESTGFEAPYTLEEGLRRMIRADFLGEAPAPDRPGASERSGTVTP
jgi:GlcNAc-P-P-Und epimerase